jgi:hypothetical protein
MGPHVASEHIPRTTDAEPKSRWSSRRATDLLGTGCYVNGRYSFAAMVAMDVSKLAMAYSRLGPWLYVYHMEQTFALSTQKLTPCRDTQTRRRC